MFSTSALNRIRINGFKSVKGFSGKMLGKASTGSDYKMVE